MLLSVKNTCDTTRTSNNKRKLKHTTFDIMEVAICKLTLTYFPELSF